MVKLFAVLIDPDGKVQQVDMVEPEPDGTVHLADVLNPGWKVRLDAINFT